MSNLYEITKELQDLEFEKEGNTDAELMACLTAAIEGLSTTLDQKLSGCCAWVKNLEAEAEMFKAEAKRLKDKADRLERKAEAFRDYMAKCLPLSAKWSSGPHSLSWRPSSQVVLDIVPERLPPVYQRVKIEADKAQLKRDLAMGAKVEGVSLVEKMNLQVK